MWLNVEKCRISKLTYRLPVASSTWFFGQWEYTTFTPNIKEVACAKICQPGHWPLMCAEQVLPIVTHETLNIKSRKHFNKKNPRFSAFTQILSACWIKHVFEKTGSFKYPFMNTGHIWLLQNQGLRDSNRPVITLVVEVMALSLLVSILGDCWLFIPWLALFFFLKWRLACTHSFHSLCQDQSTVGQQAEMTVAERSSQTSVMNSLMK